MSKTSLRIRLAKMLMRFATIETDKGILNYEGELAPGIEVFIEDENGEIIPAPDGEYIAGDNKIIVKEGLVESIEPVQQEEEKKEEEMEEEVVEEPANNGTEDAIMALANEIEMIKTEIENIKAEIEGIKTAAVDTSVEEGFTKTPKWNKI